MWPKRTFDLIVAGLALAVLSPPMAMVAVAIWLQDFHSPLYRAQRVGRGGRRFTMIKFRSMVVHAERSGVSSTANDDQRITTFGRWMRQAKIDELLQLWNVLAGDMSIVGPRPQTPAGAALYTREEQLVLTLRPGITDLASIVFSDEGDILHGSPDPDRRYDEIIRPWKSRLAILYVKRRTFWMDLRIIYLTFVAILAKGQALDAVQTILRGWGAEELLLRMASRREPLLAYPPPGSGALNPEPLTRG